MDAASCSTPELFSPDSVIYYGILVRISDAMYSPISVNACF